MNTGNTVCMQECLKTLCSWTFAWTFPNGKSLGFYFFIQYFVLIVVVLWNVSMGKIINQPRILNAGSTKVLPASFLHFLPTTLVTGKDVILPPSNFMGIYAMSCMILHHHKLALQRRTHVHVLLQNIKNSTFMFYYKVQNSNLTPHWCNNNYLSITYFQTPYCNNFFVFV